MTHYIQVLTTVKHRKEGRKIGRKLVNDKLAACVQILGPISSIYEWKSKLEETKEWICVIKTRGDLYQKVEAAIKEMHSYEMPEIIAMPITCGSKDYFDWADKSTL
ncbi:cytochrome C biogenesis protein CcdA [candidate division WOR-1 bacterium RIFOXYD2_FULL_36_8]|uniref:Cytochrome C biogenesis protein CcdA n=1 Tax=candidate division WOR-1 bacterium RIFOXYB2_FULL_36_35 TaxID=1802578 RepID=A0A1F4S2J2_UNCSA|nr:MAG: cytochrome C biogenesis protein CcdA [candidate division WOR-1 bacterium RIFOXYA2_FULL_36_21]OGC14652.1 MAG: cytochrome C biogenesis protein CcdA [candidate division WOR-1 bacterium RIFOXYB2_FULL_36_35]OGC19670.1 MAG: cytochrome C biogenesis protein CcdA [candidate division WOR-1 bacterium RIFOXYA12_FULL_36_13]OGC38006.1 MAG: cytochrome C biogenesis protein CcdA [candidate division WOR-1 bacterium RIFOXYD2_FULL_36_8]